MYDHKIINTIKEYCTRNDMTLAVAESVTAGHLQAALSTATEASLFFQGGITVYNLGQKCRHLLVDPIHAASTNCVSREISAQMARQVCSLFSSDFGIAVTGYAAPVPEQGIEELFAYFTITKREQVIAADRILALPSPGAMDVQVFYANHILRTFAELHPL